MLPREDLGLDDDGLDDRLLRRKLDDSRRSHRRWRGLPGGHDGWLAVWNDSPSNLCFVEAALHVVRRRAEREEGHPVGHYDGGLCLRHAEGRGWGWITACVRSLREAAAGFYVMRLLALRYGRNSGFQHFTVLQIRKGIVSGDVKVRTGLDSDG